LNIQAPITACTKCYKVLYFDPSHTVTPLADLCAQPVPAADNYVLFIWASMIGLEDVFQLMKVWGFTHKAHLVRTLGGRAVQRSRLGLGESEMPHADETAIG
jgi:N6-adenosine-specific RNA methylase IME4